MHYYHVLSLLAMSAVGLSLPITDSRPKAAPDSRPKKALDCGAISYDELWKLQKENRVSRLCDWLEHGCLIDSVADERSIKTTALGYKEVLHVAGLEGSRGSISRPDDGRDLWASESAPGKTEQTSMVLCLLSIVPALQRRC